MFHVGQMVVCVKTPPILSCHSAFRSAPKKGDVVTIREVYLTAYDRPCVLLDEHVNGMDGGYEVGFLAENFRPVRKTDISIFTAMLNPAPTRVDA